MEEVTQIKLAQMFQQNEFEELASHPQLALAPAEIVQKLAAAQNWRVRESLALNPALVNFPEAITSLSTDIEPRVRSCLAGNPALQRQANIRKKLK